VIFGSSFDQDREPQSRITITNHESRITNPKDPLSAADSDPFTAQVLHCLGQDSNSYHLGSLLARGGMGEV
jgi:hypothetical protein